MRNTKGEASVDHSISVGTHSRNATLEATQRVNVVLRGIRKYLNVVSTQKHRTTHCSYLTLEVGVVSTVAYVLDERQDIVGPVLDYINIYLIE